MSEWGPWQRYTYTVKGYQYERMQRGRRMPGRAHPETETIHIPKRTKKSRIGPIAMALVGVEDEYAQPVNSVLNRVKAARAEKGKTAASAVSSKGAPAGGNGVATATNSPASSHPSETPASPTDAGSPSPSESS